MDCVQLSKTNIIRNLHKCTKLCQTEFVNKSEVATEYNDTILLLCKEWENIFMHFIKRRPNRSIFSMKSTNLTDVPSQLIQQIKPFSSQNITTALWGFVGEFLDSCDSKRFANNFDKIETDMGRFRAWLRTTINERSLEAYLIKILSPNGQAIVRKYYESQALLLDPEENAVLPSLAAGISSIMFALSTNCETLNQPPDSSIRSQLNSTSSSNLSRPTLFSSSTTSESFEEIEIETNKVDITAKSSNNSRLRTRIINILPIDDEDDNVSDSSDLYSPFSLLKTSVYNTGLNFVSKFQFGNEEKLTDIQERSSSIAKDSYTSCDSDDKPCDVHTNLEECEETEFSNCCLSLQRDVYNPIGNNVDGFHYISADLVVGKNTDTGLLHSNCNNSVSHSKDDGVETSSFQSSSSKLSESRDKLNIVTLKELTELRDENSMLKSEISVVTYENKNLHEENQCLKEDLISETRKYNSQVEKLQRENDLLKKRLKTYLVKNDSDFDENQTSIGVSDSQKLDQLMQMHADLLELNEHLQRNLVDKDIQIGMLQSKVSNLMYEEQPSGIHVDKLGTVFVNIVDCFLCGTGSKKYYCYQIKISCNPFVITDVDVKNEEWVTYRRYKEFYSLYVDLTSRNTSIKSIPFPSKWILKPTNDQLENRRRGLEMFLRAAITIILQDIIKYRTHNYYESLKSVNSDARDLSTPLWSNSIISQIFSETHAGPLILSQSLLVRVIPFFSETTLNPNGQ